MLTRLQARSGILARWQTMSTATRHRVESVHYFALDLFERNMAHVLALDHEYDHLGQVRGVVADALEELGHRLHVHAALDALGVVAHAVLGGLADLLIELIDLAVLVPHLLGFVGVALDLGKDAVGAGFADVGHAVGAQDHAVDGARVERLGGELVALDQAGLGVGGAVDVERIDDGKNPATNQA